MDEYYWIVSSTYNAECCWTIDPIDSTNSFVSNLPGAAGAIALVKKDSIEKGEPEVAASVICCINDHGGVE